MTDYRILSMDGGLEATIDFVLSGIEKQLPPEHAGFLNQVDLFAGTSVGGISALYLASHDDPSAALPGFSKFVNDSFRGMMNAKGLQNIPLAAIGLSSLFSIDTLRTYLIGQFGATTTLGDLKHSVMVVSFQLDNEQPGADRSWVPRIFSNFPGDPDRDELVVDVALRTSALPMIYPIYQSMAGTGPGFVDGAIVANNPAMCALAQALSVREVEQLLLLSIGTGRNVIGNTKYLAPQMVKGTANWGSGPWMFHASDPLILLDLLLQSGSAAVDWQCAQVLGERFHRLNAELVHERVVDDPQTQQLIRSAVEWIAAQGWFKSEAAPAAS